jgi:hypothetical protein
MGRLASGASGPEGHFRALPVVMLAPPAYAVKFLMPPSVSFARALRDIFPRQWLRHAGEESHDQVSRPLLIGDH